MAGIRVAVVIALWLAASSGLGCGAGGGSPGPTARAPAVEGGHPGFVASNILFSDYAGSAACVPCHERLWDSFRSSPMHRMTRTAELATVDAPFDGTTFRFEGDTATLLRAGQARFVRLESRRGPPKLYRVTRVIGGHYREDFAGVEVGAQGDVRPIGGRDELVLPVSFLRFSGSLRYKGYSVMVHERSGLAAGPVWNQTCLFCHNTVPYFSVLLGELAGKRAPHFQGEVVDRLLPDERAWGYEVSDPGALARSLVAEMARLGAPPLDPQAPVGRQLYAAIDATKNRFNGDRLLEVGIGCESCHGGSREHARNPAMVPSFEPRAPFLAVHEPPGPPQGARARQINHVCARCHQVLFSRYPFTWEGGRRHALPGGSHINSGEGRDFLLGGCAGEMSCTTCHDPHASDGGARARLSETPAGNSVCLPCHAELKEPSAQRAHSHHAPDGAAGACVACHMPRKNMSLDTRLTRYHRIGSPTDPVRVLADRPIECALCHADKSVDELVTSMEHLWHKSYDRDALRSLYGDLGNNALRATLERGKPHERATAMVVLGERRDRAAVAGIARELTNEYPLVREFAKRSLDDVLGHPCELRMYEGDEAIDTDAAVCLRAAGLTPPPGSAHGAHPADPSEQPED